MNIIFVSDHDYGQREAYNPFYARYFLLTDESKEDEVVELLENRKPVPAEYGHFLENPIIIEENESED